MRQILSGARGNGFEVLLTAGVVTGERGLWFVSVNRDQTDLENIRERKFIDPVDARRLFDVECAAMGVTKEDTT